MKPTMTPKHFIGGLLLASVAGLSLAAMPGTAEAGPPFTPPGLAKKGGFPPGAQKFGHGGFCPPGLRDKGCVPPGLQKRFHHGDRIPDWRSYERLHYRDYGLRRPGPEQHYIRIGRDAYLISEGTQRVIDAINLFDQIGR